MNWIRKNWILLGILIIVLAAVAYVYWGPKNSKNYESNTNQIEKTKDSLYNIELARRARLKFIADSTNKANEILSVGNGNGSIIMKTKTTTNCGTTESTTEVRGFDFSTPKKSGNIPQGSNKATRPSGNKFRPGPVQSRTSVDVQEQPFNNSSFQKSTTTSGGTSSRRVESTMTPAGGGNLSTTLYKGFFSGPYWNTIDQYGNLIYAVKDSAYAAGVPILGEPILNSNTGVKLKLYNNGYWVYITDRKVSVGEINNPNVTIDWGIYSGTESSGAESHEKWFPLGWVVPTIIKARGRQDGEMSDADLIKMHQIDPNIWAPGLGGTIKFFREGDPRGHVIGGDGKLYVGAYLSLPIVASSKTTSTN